MGQSSDRLVFDAGTGGRLRIHLAAAAVTVGTLGFGFPMGFVLVRRWRARHSTIDGLPLEFTGSARELFRDWLPWWMLTLGTLGVYGVWTFPRVARWADAHTRVAVRQVWAYDATPSEPTRPLAAPSRLSLAFFTEAGVRRLAG
jgi:uncharacterized membrane protein YjgN (DUF898 family)